MTDQLLRSAKGFAIWVEEQTESGTGFVSSARGIVVGFE